MQPSLRTVLRAALRLATIGLLGLPQPALAGTAAARTPEDSVRAALASSPGVLEAAAGRDATAQTLAQAKSRQLPSIDLRGAGGPEYSNNPSTRAFGAQDGTASDGAFRSELRLSLSQMLFDGYATRGEITRQSARLAGAAEAVDDAAATAALDAVEAHLDVLRNATLLRIAEGHVASLRRLAASVRALQVGGQIGIGDLHQARARVAAAEASRAAARGAAADAATAYRKAVGEPPGALVAGKPPVAALPPDGEAAAAVAADASPAIARAVAQAAAATAQITVARAEFYPRLDAELGSDADRNLNGVQGGNVGASALLVLRYNLYRGGGDIAREREAASELAGARAAVERVRRAVEADARRAFDAWLTARDRHVALAAQAEADHLTRDAYGKEFDFGRRPLLDLLDAERELYVSRSNETDAAYTERFAVYRVLAAMGGLLAALGIPHPDDAAPDSPPGRP